MLAAEIGPVGAYAAELERLLTEAQEIKPNGAIEPTLTTKQLGEGISVLEEISKRSSVKGFAAIETACRDLFYKALASNSIENYSFGRIWNLLDIVSILSDQDLCEPGLIFWLVEELLDSQTIDGCRIVFDYLDSRRDRLTAKHFEKKNLIILRSCNELLRRLSRAEDTVFCGRVFIFLFQSFPLGDKSSVNLRGEFHVENVTTFEPLAAKAGGADLDDMEIESEATTDATTKQAGKDQTSLSPAVTSSPSVPKSGLVPDANMKDRGQDDIRTEQPMMDMNELYSVFWSLQKSFSRPTTLFDDKELEAFQAGLGATMQRFKQVQHDHQTRGPTRLSNGGKLGTKRKREGQEDKLSNAFNPKYLTSRDLFELEISDLAFRRHILVQSLILIDFLLSLSPKAKKKLGTASNKSVLYAYVLSEENTKWAINTRADIANYLQQGPEGKFYYRMVDTVLSRDKNWTYWKAEACPPIARPAIAGEDYSNAIKGSQKSCTSKRLRPIPVGTLDLKFLADSNSEDVMEKLKLPERYLVPTAESFERPIADDEFEIDMCKTEGERAIAEEARASKLWRTLRVASKTKLKRFDKIEDGKNLKALFESEREPEPEPEADAKNVEDTSTQNKTDQISAKEQNDTGLSQDVVDGQVMIREDQENAGAENMEGVQGVAPAEAQLPGQANFGRDNEAEVE